MRGNGSTIERRAQRLLRWYPRVWRARYGEEFAALLVADMEERPRSVGRTTDVIANSALARLHGVGLAGPTLNENEQARFSLAVLTATLASFLVLGVAMWSQLTVDWQWSRPAAQGTAVAVVAMSACVLVFAVLALCAIGALLWGGATAIVTRQIRRVGGPMALVLTGLAVVVLGSHHFGNGWPGTGGHRWAQQGMVPGGVAAFSWASTLSVSTYWIHPSALLRFPATEIAWMVISPMALACTVVGAIKIVRRVPLSPRLLRIEITLGKMAAGVMAVFTMAASLWMLEGASGPRGLFHTGAIDRFALVIMALSVLLALHAIHRTRGILLPLHSP
jgi:hypothetical protein